MNLSNCYFSIGALRTKHLKSVLRSYADAIRAGMPGNPNQEVFPSEIFVVDLGDVKPVSDAGKNKGGQNRRVELVISGDVIGTEIGTPIAAR